MTDKIKAAWRANATAAYERTSSQDNATTSCWALDRLPTPMRQRYLADCLAGDTAYRHLMQARQLLEGAQP
jgi:hypothetical protein